MSDKEYIEREAVLNKCLTAVMLTCDDKYELVNLITQKEVRNIPAADVQPVKRGKWIICSDGYYPYCSECRCEPKSREMTKYCAECGAKMDKKEERYVRDIFMTR